MIENDARISSEEYFAALELPANRPGTSSALEAALARAHELRKFEIDNYWKRSNYFWLFQAGAITLTGLIYSHDQSDQLLLLSTGLGAVTAQVGWLTARGSKFWQSNWEAHVDFLEQKLEGKLTQIILYQKDAIRSSVSKVNERLYGLLLIIWLLVFTMVAVKLILGHLPDVPSPIVGIGGSLMLLAAISFVLFRSRSSLNPGSTKKLSAWVRFRTPRSKGGLTIFNRSLSDDADAIQSATPEARRRLVAPSKTPSSKRSR